MSVNLSKQNLRRFALPALSASALLLAAAMAPAASITVQSVSVSGSADLDLDNDYTRIAGALAQVQNTDTITFEGVFELGGPASADGTAKGEAWQDYAAAAYYFDFPAAITGVTLTAVGQATVRMDPLTPDVVPDPYPDASFLYWSKDAVNLTIENLKIENFDYALGEYNTVITGLTIQNCHINGAPYSSRGNTMMIPLYLYPVSKNRDNVSIINNTFEFVANAATLTEGGNRVYYPQVRMIYLHTSTYPNLSISGNTFQATVDPNMPGATESTFKVTAACWPLFENMNASNFTWNFAIDNNTFDGGVTLGSSTFRTFYTAQIICPPKRTLPAVGTRDGNTYRNCLMTVDNTWVWTASNAAHVLEMGNSTFENNGWSLSPLPDEGFRLAWAPTAPGLTAIKNLTTGTYGGPGAKKVSFKFPLSVNGQTDRSACHEIANLETFFEAVSDGSGGSVDAGILAARVIDPPIVPVQDSKYNGLRWFSQPPFVGEETEVMGYTVIGDPAPAEDPNFINTSTVADQIIDIDPGTVYAVAPGSVITHNLTFRTTPVKFGAPSATGSIAPTSNSAIITGNSLFKIGAGATVTFQNLVITGDSPGVGGIYDAIDGFTFTGAGTVVIDGCTLGNFISTPIIMSLGGTATVSNSIVQNCARGFYTGDGTVATQERLTVEDTVFNNIGTVIWANRGINSFKKNVITSTVSSTMFSNSPSDLLTLGTAGEGNIWMRNAFFSFNGRIHLTAVEDGSIVMAGNWHKNVFGNDIDNDGFVEGDVDVYLNGTQPNIVAGVRGYVPVPGTAPSEPTGQLSETNLIAQFDRDLDALPDIWEVAGPSNMELFDTDNDGWPDGVEVAQGTNPNDNASFPAGTFDINADADDNGIADWYEESLLALTTIQPFLGDVLGDDGSAGLQDAVRSLQIVNGAFGTKDLSDGDLNALDVTGLGVSSLGNPLQILRFQAGVRQKLPALSGIN